MRTAMLRSILGLGALASLLACAGCFNPFRPLISNETAIATPAPFPKSAVDLMGLFKWCWENRDDVKYREVFTADYVFEFSAADSSGRLYHDNPWRREDELIFAHNLFVAGSASEAPASSITLNFSNLQVGPDLRPGKTYPVHQSVTTYTSLVIQKTDGTALNVTGDAQFYVVRGDSADIPSDLGFGPDSKRWYIERQVDKSAGSSSPVAWLHPARPGSLRIATLAAASPAGSGRALPAGSAEPAQTAPFYPPLSQSVTLGWLRAAYGPQR